MKHNPLQRHSLILAFASLALLNQAQAVVVPLESGVERVISPVDNPDIVSPGHPMERSLKKLDTSTPRQKMLAIRPWSDGLWGTDTGITASRYSDPNFNTQGNWSRRRAYVEQNSINRVLSEPDSQKRAQLIDRLSPAEKYDLIAGDANATLSESQWAVGEKLTRDGTLASWMGICEGSAAAGVMYPEPGKTVVIQSPQGDPVPFHILDIKALSSLLWSAYNANITVAGSRCPNSNPEVDSHGVVIDEGCFNTNPGTLHIALLNLIGARDRPFFIDRVPGVEVWNVPVLGYRIQYSKVSGFFHGRRDKLSDAVVRLSDYRNDPYKAHRSSDAVFIVGVDLTLKVAEGYTLSRDASVKSPPADMGFSYDLELTANMEIVGGEWHGSAHPDFIWALESDFRPISAGERNLQGDWDGNAVPAYWIGAIQQSSRLNQPFERIIHKLVELSN